MTAPAPTSRTSDQHGPRESDGSGGGAGAGGRDFGCGRCWGADRRSRRSAALARASMRRVSRANSLAVRGALVRPRGLAVGAARAMGDVVVLGRMVRCRRSRRRPTPVPLSRSQSDCSGRRRPRLVATARASCDPTCATTRASMPPAIMRRAAGGAVDLARLASRAPAPRSAPPARRRPRRGTPIASTHERDVGRALFEHRADLHVRTVEVGHHHARKQRVDRERRGAGGSRRRASA